MPSSPSSPSSPSAPSALSPTSGSVLFHLGYPLPSDFLRSSLCSVRYVLLCGSISRATAIASHFRGGPHTNLCRTDRYTLLQPHAEVLVAAHGIGAGSIDVLLHELHIAIRSATAGAYALIRIGSCGGVGVAAGTVVVTRQAVNGLFERGLRLAVLGKQRVFAAEMDEALGEELAAKGRALLGKRCVRGDTMSAETFYVAQARRDGAFADFSGAERAAFLEECRSRGVVNVEMECVALAAFAKRVGVRAATVCAVLVNRMQEETPSETEEMLAMFQHRAVRVAVEYVREKVGCGGADLGKVSACINGAVRNMSHNE